jgi:HK97 family phage portal protein
MWPFRHRAVEPPEHERVLFNVGDIGPYAGRYTVYNHTVVTADTAGRLSAVWRCLVLLCDVISTLPIDVYRAGSRVPVDPSPQLFTRPAADMPFDEWVWIFLWEALTSPAAWGLIVDRSGPGLRPSQIEPLCRGRVTAATSRNSDRAATVYRLDGREVDPADLFRFRLYPAAGSVVGLDPVAYAAEAIGAGLAAQRFGAEFFADSAIPSGILTTDSSLSAENADAMHDRWQAKRQGRRDTAVLGNGLKFQAITVSPEESQNLETRKFSIQEACRYFGVPPEMIGSEAGGSLTYANVEQRDLDFLKYGVGPKMRRLESALNGLLPRGQYVKFNTGALLRTDLKTRYESYALALAEPRPWLTVDEVRELEDREPIDQPATTPATLGVVA